MKHSSIASLLCCVCLVLPVASRASCFQDAADKYAINPVLLESIAIVESNLNQRAINRNMDGTSDIGIMQINSNWLKSTGIGESDLMDDVCLNIMTGARILRRCIDKHGYNWEAVGCYNARNPAKRANYAWKVFRQIKNNTGTRAQSQAKEPDRGVNETGKSFSNYAESSPSLSFHVKDITKLDRSNP